MSWSLSWPISKAIWTIMSTYSAIGLTVITILTDIHHSCHLSCHPSSPSYCYPPSCLLNLEFDCFNDIMGTAWVIFILHCPHSLSFKYFFAQSSSLFVSFILSISSSLNQCDIISGCLLLLSAFISLPHPPFFLPMFLPSRLAPFKYDIGSSKHLLFLGWMSHVSIQQHSNLFCNTCLFTETATCRHH